MVSFSIKFFLFQILLISSAFSHNYAQSHLQLCFTLIIEIKNFRLSYCSRYIYQENQIFNIIFLFIDQLNPMEPQEDIQVLPRRNSQYKSNFKNASPCRFFTNIYEITLNTKDKNRIYQFAIETTPEIPQDSTGLYRKIFKSIHKQLKQKISDFFFSGTMIWSFQNLSKAAVLQSQFQDSNNQKRKYDVIIKPIKQIQISEMLSDPIKKKVYLQIFNSKIQETVLNYLKLVKLGAGKYFNFQPISKDIKVDLQIRRGFKLTLYLIGNKPCVQIDVCSKISRRSNFLAELNNYNSQAANNNFKGAIVLTRYGKLRTYRIQEIDFTKNPSFNFWSDKEAGSISLAEYYKRSYEIKTMNMTQPLIRTILRVEKSIKEGKLVEKEIQGFLIPQLVSLTGMSDQMRGNHHTMKEIAPFTKLEPKQRAQCNKGLIQKFNKDPSNELIKINNQRNVEGVVLNNVKIVLGDGYVLTNDGEFRYKNKIKNPAIFKDWLFVYSRSKNSKVDDNEADRAVDYLKQCSKAFGIKVQDPGFIALGGSDINNWKKQIQNDIKNNGAPQIVLMFFQKYEEKLYSELKRFLTKELKVPSQVIRRRTLSNQQQSRNMSAASKILLQMNAKIGLPLWQVPESVNAFGKKSIMYGALSISKGAKGYTLAFVGTIDKTCSRVFSEAIVGIKKKEQIPQTMFDSIFKNWAKNYYKTTKSVPELIIMYRQGLSEAQIQKQAKPEIRSIHNMINVISQKVKLPNYNPQILFIGVNKKINMRFYNILGKEQEGKFIPNLGNPDSGSVIVQQLSVGGLMDFHLAAQKVTQGTCTPTQYIVIYKNCEFSIEALAEFTYGQCFSYYNWSGAVRVPACLQCADKLSKLIGQSIKQDTTGIGDLENKHYFL